MTKKKGFIRLTLECRQDRTFVSSNFSWVRTYVSTFLNFQRREERQRERETKLSKSEPTLPFSFSSVHTIIVCKRSLSLSLPLSLSLSLSTLFFSRRFLSLSLSLSSLSPLSLWVCVEAVAMSASDGCATRIQRKNIIFFRPQTSPSLSLPPPPLPPLTPLPLPPKPLSVKHFWRKYFFSFVSVRLLLSKLKKKLSFLFNILIFRAL
jgi:hypothetical protein